MQILLGIDLGTSSIKAMLLDVEYGVVAVESKSYDVSIPEPNCAEQDPHVWWEAAVELLKRFQTNHTAAFRNISAIGLTGQMHGLVTVDKAGEPIRPAIIWLDQRSGEEVETINTKTTDWERRELLHNRIYPGFLLPSLLWLKNHEPDVYKRVDKVMQPKDYVRYRLTGCIGTEVSDASATAAFDVKNRQWAYELIERLGIDPDVFPECRESTEVCGYTTAACHTACGLKTGIPVICGCGDQMAQSIGNGIITEGDIVSNIGTGGQISTYSETDIYDEQLRTHTFCHALNKAYTIFGATLSCGLSLRWLTNKVLDVDDFEKCNAMACQIAAGSDGVLYLPYLSGERTPIMNSQAKGVIFGLKFEHDKRHIIRAAMEGMIYSLKDSLLLLEEMGITNELVIASGGGAVSSLLLQMQADIFEKRIKVCNVKEQACLGVCLLAGVGTGAFSSMKEACNRFVTFSERIYLPESNNKEVYRNGYNMYHALYRNTEDLMNNGG